MLGSHTMGAWSYGPFDNDDALDAVEDVKSGDFPVEELLPQPTDNYIDADQGAIVVALAKLATLNEDELPEGVTADHVSQLREPGMKDRLRQALDAVLMDASVSELYDNWAEAGEGELLKWKAASHCDF